MNNTLTNIWTTTTRRYPARNRRTNRYEYVYDAANVNGTMSSFGSVIGVTPLVCGGNFTRHCFFYDRCHWRPSAAKLSLNKTNAASVQLDPNTWWVMGGLINGYQPTQTTEIYRRGGLFEKYVDLPKTGRANCAKLLNKTHLILLGGEDKDRR